MSNPPSAPVKRIYPQHPPLAPRRVFVCRVLKKAGLSLAMLLVSLGFGMGGYHWIADFTWLDAFYNASMILGGMGPVAELHGTASKIFAGCYALLSGLLLVGAAGAVLAPVIHRWLHKFHLDDLGRSAADN
jgi:hypothetical protein